MKRWAILPVLGVLFCGCSQSKQADPAPKSAAVAPAAKPVDAAADSKLYFEMNKDGRTYVFGTVASMQKVARGEQLANLVIKEKFGPAGETVAFESNGAGMEARLMQEYEKQHPKK